MNTEEFRARWAAALRSGDYKQGRGRLRSNDAYCCLGVACDVVDPSGWEFVPEGGYVHDGQCVIPSNRVALMAGIDLCTASTLITMNDHDGTFAEIADWISENL